MPQVAAKREFDQAATGMTSAKLLGLEFCSAAWLRDHMRTDAISREFGKSVDWLLTGEEKK